MDDVKSEVRAFVVENFLFGEANGLSDDTSFLDEGIIDSTGVLELVNYLEGQFEIQIEDDELVPENLDSLNAITAFLYHKIAASSLYSSNSKMVSAHPIKDYV